MSKNIFLVATKVLILLAFMSLTACGRPEVITEAAPPTIITPPAALLSCPSEPRLHVPAAEATDSDAWIYAENVRSWGRVCKSRLEATKSFIEKESAKP